VFLVTLSMLAMTAASAQAVDGRVLERIRHADADGDGAVTRAEFVAYRASQFQTLDRNHDSTLSVADAPRFAGRAPMGIDVAAMTAQFDANGDGRVSQAEYVNGPTPAFDQADANHNQIVTRAELDAAVATARRKG